MPDVTTQVFGLLPDGREVHRISLSAGAYTASILTLGATLHSVLAPDRRGDAAEVLLGARSVADQFGAGRYFGATIGRYANRIARGRFTLDGREYQVSVNDGPNSMHGGVDAFDLRLWQSESRADDEGAQVTLSLISPDGDQGFPAALRAEVTYRLSPDGRLRIAFTATNLEPALTPEGAPGQATVVSLCNHAYLNLDGVGSGSVDRHLVKVNAQQTTEVDDELIPSGRLIDVEGTPLDFRTPRELGVALRADHLLVSGPHGLDHNWVIDPAAPSDPLDASLREAAELVSPASGRRVRIYTDRPGIQLYTANHLDGTLAGAEGTYWRQGDGIALETQLYADSPNHEHFPSARLGAGEVTQTVTVLAFSAE